MIIAATAGAFAVLLGGFLIWLDGVEEDEGITYDSIGLGLVAIAVGLALLTYSASKNRRAAVRGIGIAIALLIVGFVALAVRST